MQPQLSPSERHVSTPAFRSRHFGTDSTAFTIRAALGRNASASRRSAPVQPLLDWATERPMECTVIESFSVVASIVRVSCPVPPTAIDRIGIAHGGGRRMTSGASMASCESISRTPRCTPRTTHSTSSP